jgi:hypothetical protein
MWILSAALYVSVFPVAGIMHSSIVAFIMLATTIIFLVRMYILSFRGELMINWRKAFMTVNLFYLFIIVVLIADQFLESYLYV